MNCGVLQLSYGSLIKSLRRMYQTACALDRARNGVVCCALIHGTWHQWHIATMY